MKIFNLPVLTVGLLSLFISLSCRSAPQSLSLESAGMQVDVSLIATGDGKVWGMAWLGENRLLYTLAQGAMGILDLSSGKQSAVEGVPEVAFYGQGGLMDVQLHPQFAKNGLIFFTHAYECPSGHTTVLKRAKLDLEKNKLSDVETLFKAEPCYSGGRHFGSRIAFGGDGKLYLSVGDRGNRDYAQDLSRHNGKILRLNFDGTAAAGNPFEKTPGAQAEIWSHGHRNPQGLAAHPKTGKIFAQEHGPRGGDEINAIKKGANYGWPTITYGKEYSGRKVGKGLKKKAGLEQPIHYWVPSIAPSGFMIYSGKEFPQWEGSFFSGALKHQHLNRLAMDGQKVLREERLVKELSERVRHVITIPGGKILFSTDSGKIYQLSRAK